MEFIVLATTYGSIHIQSGTIRILHVVATALDLVRAGGIDPVRACRRLSRRGPSIVRHAGSDGTVPGTSGGVSCLNCCPAVHGIGSVLWP